MENFLEYRENKLVYFNGEYITNDVSLKGKINKHIEMYSLSKNGRIWYSHPLDVVYSEFQTSLHTHNKNDAFLDNRETWHEGNQGIPRIVRQTNGKDEGGNFYWTGFDINYNDEYFISDNDSLSKYRDSSILILGGGPTTSLVDWKNVDRDYLWTMNHFFLNKTILDHKPDLISLGNEINFSKENEKLHEFITNQDSDIIIQPNDVRKNISSFTNEFHNRISYYSPRWNGKLGAAHRLLLLAIFLNVKHIYIAGVDGITPSFNRDLGSNGLHSFQRDVHFKEGYGYDIMVVQNVIFWQYVMDLQKKYNFTITNLGEGHPSNMATEITKKYFKGEN